MSIISDTQPATTADSTADRPAAGNTSTRSVDQAASVTDNTGNKDYSLGFADDPMYLPKDNLHVYEVVGLFTKGGVDFGTFTSDEPLAKEKAKPVTM